MTISKSYNHQIKLNFNHSICEIHNEVRCSATLIEAAHKLSLRDCITLSSHLARFILDGKILDFDSFQQMSVERALEIWGENYYLPMVAPLIVLNKYSIAHLHEIACGFLTIREAATKLGTRDHTLKRFLQEKGLKFTRFRQLSPEQLGELFGDIYRLDLCEQRINLTPEIPLAKIPPFTLAANTTKDMDLSGLKKNRKNQVELADDFAFFSTQNRNNKRGAPCDPEYIDRYNLRSKKVNAPLCTLDQQSHIDYLLNSVHSEDADDQAFKQSLSEITAPPDEWFEMNLYP